jgi:superoxide reductase
MTRRLIQESIHEYNKYHGSEAVVDLISFDDKVITLKFTGTFCYTCGFYDYFEDFQVLLEEQGMKTTIETIIELHEGARVTLSVIQ